MTLKKVAVILSFLPILMLECCLCWGQGASGGDAGASTVEGVLKQIENKAKGLTSLSGSFRQVKFTRLLVTPMESEGTFTWQPPDCFRWEVKEPTPFTLVVHGDSIMALYADLNRATLYRHPLGGGLLGQISGTASNAQEFSRTYHLELIPTEEKDGQHLVRLSMRPRSERQEKYLKRVDVLVDPDKWLPERISILEGNSDVSTINLSNLIENPGLPNDFFDVTPPEGVQVERFQGGRQQ